MSHSHARHHHGPGHDHAHDRGALNQSRLGWAAVLTGTFMLVEAVGGVISGSLALLADAGHMLTDFAALALAWFAARVARRPADWRRTYGFDRFAVLVAFVNGLSLVLIAALIVVEAIRRFAEPVEVMGPLMLAVATAGLAVNVAAFWLLHGADRNNLNIRGAAVHVMGDLLGSVAAIAAAIVIILTGWMPIDPLLSLLVALLIVRSGVLVARDAGRILLEAAPPGLDSREIAADLVAGVPGVADVHHVHAWSISQERPMITLHARLDAGADAGAAVRTIKARLAQRFGIDHATVEIEAGACADDGHADPPAR